MFDAEFFWDQLLSPSPQYLGAVWRTIYMAVAAQLLGILIGVVIGFGRLSRSRIARFGAATYVWFMRGVPVLVIMVMLFTGLAASGIYRFSDITVLGVRIVAPVQAAIVALAINEGAYMGEIIRNGIQSVGKGQIEAAQALGMPWWMRMRRVVIPQATRVIVPPLGNNFNVMLKTTSLASVIGVQELFLSTRTMAAATFRVFELFTAAAVAYLLLTTAWSFVQAWIEWKLRRPELDADATFWDLVKSLVGAGHDTSTVREAG